MSRKTIFTVLAVLGGILGVIQTTFGLTLNTAGLIAGITAVLVYVFGEAKADLARLKAQADKWKDPKFWITLVSAALASLVTAGIELPISPEIIIAVLTAIVGVLFKKEIDAARAKVQV